MAGVLDQFITVGKEATYGTAATTLTRGYEATDDTWQRDVDQLTGTPLRAGKHATLEARRRPIDLGATGSLSGTVTTSGMGLLLDGLLGETTAISQAGATTAYTQAFATNTEGSDSSYTVQVVRVDTGGVARPSNYTGCVATSFNFAAERGGDLTYRIDYAAQGEDPATAVTPTYAAGNENFIYSDVTLAIDDTTTSAITSFSFDGDLALDIDRRFLRGNARRARPLRNGEPSFTGTLSAEFADLEIYNAFVAGTSFKLEITGQTSDIIATDSGTDYYHTFKLTMPACRFDGSTPNASTSALTTIDAPFTVVYNGTDPAVSITYISEDTAQ